MWGMLGLGMLLAREWRAWTQRASQETLARRSYDPPCRAAQRKARWTRWLVSMYIPIHVEAIYGPA